jgi:pSer/pThr/pTyr-binding forkhead associated (FHA) protein
MESLLITCIDKIFFKFFVTWFLCAEFKKDDYTVGKDAACSYVIKDSQLSKTEYTLLSKKQFKISRKKDAVYLEDVGGTYVNNIKIGQGNKTVLNHNDCIAIAKSHLKGKHYCQLYISQSTFSSTYKSWLHIIARSECS